MKTLHEAAQEAEKELIVKTLAECMGNRSKAARLLKVDRKTLYNKMTEMKITGAFGKKISFEVVQCECGKLCPIEFSFKGDDGENTCASCQVDYLESLILKTQTT